jgi:hypothetical protein
LPGVPEDRPAKGRLRRAREALLLELGALVYELHRQGRRAPELLQRKAGELSEVDEQLRADGPDQPGPASCPSCGAEAEPGQLVCTNCGARLALDRARPGLSVAALAAIAVVALLGAAASGFALSEITSDDGDDAPAASQAPPPPSAAAGDPQEQTRAGEPADGSPQEPTQSGEPAGGSPPETTPAEDPADDTQPDPRRPLLLDWPEGLTAHTVVLVTTSDRPAALRLARQAARSGIEAGLLRGDDYNLGAGLWVVFAGRFDSPEGASRQASDLAERFPGAYPRLVEPAG